MLDGYRGHTRSGGPETTTTTQPRPLTNERGFVPKKLGDNSCYGSTESDPCASGVTFAIDKIVVDPPCDEFGERSRHTLVLSLRVATGIDSASSRTEWRLPES